MLIKAKELEGYSLQSKDGDIGKVKEFYFDDRHWVVRYLIVNTGNWLEDRSVLLSPYALRSVNKETKQVSVDLTKKQIEECPPLDTDKPVSHQYEAAYHSYYGWPAYWEGSFAWGSYPLIFPHDKKVEETNAAGKAWNPNLRSALGVKGYSIEALDGEIGRVKDFILDDENWGIHYMVVETGNFLFGKKVLISPNWIERVSWDDSKVVVNLSLEAIKESPEYSEDNLLTRDYETLLYGHYNRDGYWIKNKAK